MDVPNRLGMKDWIVLETQEDAYNMEKIPDQTSNAGPAEPVMDWRDWLSETEEFCKAARRAEWDPKRAARLRYVRKAMDALKEAEALLCR